LTPSIGYIDSHAHLADAAFDDDRDAVIAAARADGARAIIAIGESFSAARASRALALQYPGFVYATAGVHPGEAGGYDRDRDEAWIRDGIAHGAVAIGECGLDYHYGHVSVAAQRAAFSDQIALAESLRRPLVVHTRDAEADTRAAIEGTTAVGVLHCYTGSHDLALAALARGWFVSLSGIVTFARWSDDALVRLVPEDRLLIETDAPYLAPVPVRGRRNEPRFARHTMERVAQVRGVSAERLGAVVTANARRLFGLATDARG
jgi:TatD DNase family protein